jgi:formate hydrogenlyase subunit 3/multisubunit Na+/H+ antiporter MnhD subunit
LLRFWLVLLLSSERQRNEQRYRDHVAMAAAVSDWPVPIWLVPAIPALSSLFLVLLGNSRVAFGVNAASSFASVLAVLASLASAPSAWWLTDALSHSAALLIAWVGFAVSIVCLGDRREHAEQSTLILRYRRLSCAIYQALLAVLSVAVLAKNFVFAAVALELGAVLFAVLIALGENPKAMPVAWRFFIANAALFMIGLLGIAGLYAAHRGSWSGDWQAMGWAELQKAATEGTSPAAHFGLIAILVGFGGLATLMPFHAHALDVADTAPAPISIGLMIAWVSVPLNVLMRLQPILAAQTGAGPTRLSVLGFGLFSLVFGCVAALRTISLNRFLALSLVQYTGLTLAAFGLGSRGAIGGLLQFGVHTLLKTSLLPCIKRGSARNSKMGVTGNGANLAAAHCWRFVFALNMLALAGLPPFGGFAAWVIIATAGAKTLPWVLVPLAAGGWLSGLAVMYRLRGFWSAPASSGQHAGKPGFASVEIVLSLLSLSAALLAGIALPSAVYRWLENIALLVR